MHIYLFIYAFIAVVLFVSCLQPSFMLYQFLLPVNVMQHILLRSSKTNRMIRFVNNNLFIWISVKCVDTNKTTAITTDKRVVQSRFLAQTERHTYREEKCVKHEETMSI